MNCMEFHTIDQNKDEFKEVGLSSVQLDTVEDFDEQARKNRAFIAEGNERKLSPFLLQPDIRFDGQMAASSFQSVWTKLVSNDLSAEKSRAMKEIHERTEQVLEHGTTTSSILNKIPSYCACGIAVHRLNRNRSSCRPLRSTTLVDEQLLIVALSKVAFCNNDPVHWELLYSIFRLTTDDRGLSNTGSRRSIPRFGSHWERIGFQGKDPATDLRGVGIFGLCQLLFLVSNGLTSQMIAQMLDISNDHIQGFPLAVVGLNFTQMILDRVKQSKLNYQHNQPSIARHSAADSKKCLYREMALNNSALRSPSLEASSYGSIATKENSFLSCVNGIYRGSFIVFLRMWKSRNCSIGDFAAISNEIKELVKRKPKQLLNMAILTHSV